MWLGCSVTHRFGGLLVAVGVDGGQQVDACLVHEPPNACVSAQILLTHELHEQQQQLAAQNLVTVGTSRVAELRLTCEHTHHTHDHTHTHTSQACYSVLGLTTRVLPSSCSPGLSEISMA